MRQKSAQGAGLRQARGGAGGEGATSMNRGAAVLLLLVITCGSRGWADGARLPDAPESVILVVFDGCTDAVFSELLSAGRFPNVFEHVVQRGVRVHTCTTTYPSATIPAYAALTAGLLPRQAHMPGIRWFDRRSAQSCVYCGSDFWRVDRDLNPAFPTIFELLPPGESVCAGGAITRGFGHTLRPLPAAGRGHVKARCIGRGSHHAGRVHQVH